MKLWLPIATVAVVAALVVFFVWAPVVPFERLESILAPTSAVPCPGTQICEIRFYSIWVRSYGSFAYDYFGFGTAPYSGPVSVEKNGVTVLMLFDGPNMTDSVAFPSDTPEPLPMLRINGLTVFLNGAPFGGTVTQISVTNLGVGETATIQGGFGFSSSAEIPAGGTVLINSTDWTRGPLPQANTYTTITLSASIHYPKLWLFALDTQSVLVTYAT